MDGLILGGVNLTDRFDYCMDHFLRLNAGRDFRHTYQKAALELMLLGNRLRRWQEAFRGQIWANTTSEDGHDAMLAFDRIVQTLQDLSTDTESYLPTVSLADFASVTDIICEMMRVKLDKSSRPRSIWQLHDSNAEGKISRIVLYIATLENLSPELAPEIKRLANDEFEELTTEADTQDLDIFSPFRDISVNEIDPWLQEPIALREEPGTANILQLPGAYESAVAGNAVPMGEREHGSMIGMGVSNVSSRVSQPPRSGRHVSAAQQWDFGTREILHSSHDVTAYELDAMVRKQVSIGDPVLTCSLSCEFNSCLNQDLDGSTDLGDFLVITGNVLCAYATTCKDWIKQNWGPVGLSVLEAASEVLEQGRSESPHLSIRLHSDTADGDYLKASIIHPDVADIVKIVQTLVWLAVTFRPLTHNCLHYSSATASLKEGALIISLKDLAPIKPWVPTSCWHHLVGHSIIAGGFYTRAGGYGLELPFPLMLELTSMIYKTDISRLFTAEEEKISSNDDRLAQHFGEVDSTSNFESFESGPGDHRSDNDDHAAEPSGIQVQPTVVDASNVPDVDHSLPEHIESPTTGIFFTGVHSILYPTERSDAMRTLKWHYAESSDVMTPPTNGTWLRLREADLVDKKTILGYTPEVQVKLGTSDRLKQYGKMKRSRAQKEKSAWKLSLEGITIQGGFAGSGVSFPFRFVRRRGQRIALTAKPTYDQIINQTAEKPVILFDTARDRETAWLVSQLSVILDLVLLQASQKESWQDLGDAGRLALHAKPHWNGGNAAFQVLNDYGRANTVLYRLPDSNKPFAIKHLVTQIFAAMSCRTQIDREYPSRSILSTPPLLGWDLLDLTNTVGVVDRLQVDVQKHFGLNNSPTWLPLAQELPVYFCNNLGDVMNSKVPVCINMQLGQEYLVASMSALRSRLLDCAESHDWRHWHIDIKGQPMWKVPKIFTECDHGKHEQSEARSLFEEVVQLLVPTKHKCHDAMADHIVGPEEGAVVFGPKRADAPKTKPRYEMHEVTS